MIFIVCFSFCSVCLSLNFHTFLLYSAIHSLHFLPLSFSRPFLLFIDPSPYSLPLPLSPFPSLISLPRFAIKAAIILLPLLGLTWVIGFLAIGKGSQVFAWIFTILASLHGVLFFVLNVVRNDMVSYGIQCLAI